MLRAAAHKPPLTPKPPLPAAIAGAPRVESLGAITNVGQIDHRIESGATIQVIVAL